MISLGVLFSLPEKLSTLERAENDVFRERVPILSGGDAAAHKDNDSLLWSASDATLPYVSASLQRNSFSFSDPSFLRTGDYLSGSLNNILSSKFRPFVTVV